MKIGGSKSEPPILFLVFQQYDLTRGELGQGEAADSVTVLKGKLHALGGENNALYFSIASHREGGIINWDEILDNVSALTSLDRHGIEGVKDKSMLCRLIVQSDDSRRGKARGQRLPLTEKSVKDADDGVLVYDRTACRILGKDVPGDVRAVSSEHHRGTTL